MKEQNTIHFIFTGGTIDSHYDVTKDTVVPNKHSIIPEYLKQLKLYTKLKFTEICMKDSRKITKKDLKAILNVIEKSPFKMIIVIHGTYTMSDTAKYLAKNLKRRDQKIILTGAMIPLKGFDFTDASFNLGYAFANVKNVKEGIYAAMNGRLFKTNEVKKNIAKGRFYAISKNMR
jgi:L-asparaginase